MDFSKASVRDTLRRYRKHLIFAGVAIAMTVTLGVVGLGYAVYKTASYATDRVKTWEPSVGDTARHIPEQATGFVEGVMLNLASGWLQESVASGDVAQVKHGLSCFDALGGPSPAAIVGYVRSTVGDVRMVTQLEELSKSLPAAGTAAGPAACANWILNG